MAPSIWSPLIWNESLLVGNDVIDADHALAVAQLNGLADADDAAFPALFAAFADHLREHFAREEELMRRWNFPIYPIHKGEHERVLLECEGIRRQMERGNRTLARGYVREVAPDWFLGHRGSMDAVTANFIRAQEERSRGG